MSGCKCEQWTLSELSTALESKTAGNKKIVIPMFQRGKRWNAEQEKTFIDSVKEGYPVGTMFFFEKVENNQQVYVLVDGLQRSNTIKKYIHNPKENPDLIILQSRSPSCGIKQIYDGTFSGNKIPGHGLFAELCIKAGYKVLDIEDLDDYFSHN